MQEVAQVEQTDSPPPPGRLPQPRDAVERGTATQLRGKATKREISLLLN